MLNWLLVHSPLLYFTQSLWRDEAFSILASQRSLSWIVRNLSFEPPVYYTLLHFWMKLFGQSEIATRSLSLVGFTLATLVVIYWAEKLFPKHWLSWFLPLFFFLNPMLLYYAFEVRTYGWYMFFAVLSMYAYLQKRWVLYVVATTLGFYTHTYMLIVPFAEFLHWIFSNTSKISRLKSIARDPMIKSLSAIGLLISPWLVKVILESARLKESWYFPVDINLVTSVLGNMFLGYEGTPWFLWTFTKIASIVLLFLFFIALRDKRNKSLSSFFFIMGVAPLVLVIGISFIKPLFVNRYLIPVTIAQVLLIGLALGSIKNKTVQKLWAAGLLLFILFFNVWYPSQHAKLDIRKTIQEINTLKAKDDLVLTDSPLIFFETIYYSHDKNHVYLYNPNSGAFPWYVGSAIVSPSQMISLLPLYPTRAFIVHVDGAYTVSYRVPLVARSRIKKTLRQ